MTAAAGKVNPAVGIDDIGGFASAGILRELDERIPVKLFDSVYGRQFYQMDGNTYAVPIYQQMVLVSDGPFHGFHTIR